MFKQVPKNPDLGADAERVRKEEQGKIDEAEVLTEEELAEKEDLLKEVSQTQNWKFVVVEKTGLVSVHYHCQIIYMYFMSFVLNRDLQTGAKETSISLSKLMKNMAAMTWIA